MARIIKRQGAPEGLTVVSIPASSGATCGICRKAAQTRLRNSWREMDVCRESVCNERARAWVGNSSYTSRRQDPPRVWREPVETKFLSRKADAVAKPPGARARAR